MAKDKTINVWQYSRWVYLIGRSVKFRPFSTTERAAIVTFIVEMNKKRPGIAGIVNGKRDNALDYSADFKYQNDYALGKMLQRLGRDMKACFPVEGEKELCDALFVVTDARRYQTINKYAVDGIVAEDAINEVNETTDEGGETETVENETTESEGTETTEEGETTETTDEGEATASTEE